MPETKVRGHDIEDSTFDEKVEAISIIDIFDAYDSFGHKSVDSGTRTLNLDTVRKNSGSFTISEISGAAYDATVLAAGAGPGPNYRWKMNGNTTESISGHSSTGGPTGFASTIIPKDSGQCGTFDGTSNVDFLLAGAADVNTSDTNVKSIAMWIIPDSVVGRHTIFEEGGPSNWLHLYLEDDVLYWNIGESSATTQTLTSLTNFEAGELYFIVVEVRKDASYDAMRLYVNGFLEDEDVTNLANNYIPAHTGDWTIGWNEDANDHNNAFVASYFNGKIADYCYWAEQSRLLTHEEISDIYYAGLNSIEGHEVEVSKDGTYLINFRMSLDVAQAIGDDSADSRSTSRIWLELSTGTGYSIVPGTYGYMYNRYYDKGENTASITAVLDLLDGNKLRIRYERFSGTYSLTTIPQASALTIQKLLT